MRLGVISAGLLSFAVLCSSQSCLKSQEESRIHTTTHTESVTLSLPSMPTTGFSELSWKWADKVFRMRNLSIPIESDAVTYFPNGTLVLREPSVRHSGNIELEVYNHTGHCIFRGTVTLHVQDEISFGGVSTTTVNNFSKENSVMPNPQGRKNSQRGGSCIFFNSKPKREDEYVNMEPDPFSVVMRQTGRCSTEPLLTQNAKQVTADGAAEAVYVPMTYMLIKEQPEITLYEPQTSNQGTPASSSAEPRHDVYAQINFQSKEKGSARRGFSPSLDSTASD
ncbi:uncharacterized protein LOC125751187 isoform X3 [Brienomyrus brachyistius]|uniref:uncharacterized protein LOC125751187 isoform X3 n=1 Tax=Brienomyrus brachyistius TaxID=42636 RepID=UPI0020B31583|nr:uncharacterized protein LOC125751187 isoform X3 [Brienomyrus brachyistius]